MIICVNMEKDCDFANLEDKYTFKLDKMAIARWMCGTLPIQGRIARVSFRLHSHRMYTQLQILDLFSIVIFRHYSVIDIERNLRRQEDKYTFKLKEKQKMGVDRSIGHYLQTLA